MYKVIVVDDEPSMIETMIRNLSAYPEFEVISSAYMVSDAKAILQQQVPDVIFTDIRMPGGSGIELVKHVAENYPQCVMIVVSGYDTFDYVRSAFLYGVEDYLLKPVSPSSFRSFIEKLRIKLENRNMADEIYEQTLNKPRVSLPHSQLPDEDIIARIEQYVAENLADDNSIDSICRQFSISQPYLSKIFRQYRNCTYNEFLISLRIARAKRLLIERQDLLIGTIASLTGFSDQFYFSRVFKNSVGSSPSEFRKSLN